MKNLFKNLLTITVLSLVIASCSKCKDVTPPAPTNYTVTFNLNGGSGTASPQSVASGTAISLPASSASTFFFTGYTFKEWNTKSDGTGTGYPAGFNYPVSGNVTLYAIWQVGASYTVTFNLNGGTGVANPATVLAGSATILPTSSASTFYFTNYNFVNWNTAANGSGTNYAAGSSYTPTGNVTLYAIWQSAYTAVFTATDLSTTISLYGNLTVRAIRVNVTTAGTTKLDCVSSLTNGNPAISYYWIISKDSVNCTSTLNAIVPKTAMLSSQIINLPVGTYIICIKTAAYSGLIANGTTIGIKLTGANNNTLSTSGLTADASRNATTTLRIDCKLVTGKTELPGENTNDVWSILQITPYSDENFSVYDGNNYPSIYSVSFDTKSTFWFTGTFTGYTALDFTNTAGSGRDFNFIQTNSSGGNANVFLNPQATFTSGILSFSNSVPVQLLKSNGGNFAYVKTRANVYNSGSNFGPANVTWWLKGIDLGNIEIQIFGTTRVY